MAKRETFLLPDVGEGLADAEIVEWLVSVGDQVAVNQPLVEIETAKSSVELPSPWPGVVVELLAEVGQTVLVGAGLVVVDRADADAAEPAVPTEPAIPTAPATQAESATPTESAAASGEEAPPMLVGYGARPDEASATPALPSPAPAPARPLATPPVRKLAADLGVDLAAVTPSGPGGVVRREDVVGYHRAGAGQAAKPQAETSACTVSCDDNAPTWPDGGRSADGRQTRVPVRSVRRRTADAMVASAFTAPHVTVFHTVDVTASVQLVERLRSEREFAGVRVTPLLLVAKALLIAVRRHPDINAAWDEAAREIVYKHYVNLGIAAATPRGLMVPNIKDAHRLDLLGLAHGLDELTRTARAGQTTAADMADGTITITNVGVFGIDTGTPILNPGEAGILAFGAIRPQPWVHEGEIKIRQVTQLALSFDHRLVDGELGARVLADVAAVLQDPSRGLVWG